VARSAPAVLVAALLVATGIAFLHTESLKLETSPIRQTRVTKLFSPVCRCDSSRARIAFRLAKPDVLSLSIVDSSGSDVRLLASDKPGTGSVAFLWNGRDDAGRVVPNGFYRPRVRLALREKTFLLPNPIRVDTQVPRLEQVSVQPRLFSPDGDRRADRINVRYKTDEPAQVMLFVDGVRRVVGGSRTTSGELRWFGKVGARSLPARRYGLVVVAVDRAGNRSRRVGAGSVRIRYVEIASPELTARAGGLLRVRVATDAKRVRWKLDSKSGSGKTPVFGVRAPDVAGSYRLVVIAAGHRAAATVSVTAR
jgi:hypothetical protein